jgi:gentisate 1,2-dioxygenase
MATAPKATRDGSPENGHATPPTEIETAEQLLQAIKATNTAPLWAQMQRLNPPAPNPQTVPHVWPYRTIRLYLMRAGDLITEKQAERRVLMLTNPARGMHTNTGSVRL